MAAFSVSAVFSSQTVKLNFSGMEPLKAAMGKRVTLYYEEHIWLPTSCFGDTRYFVKG